MATLLLAFGALALAQVLNDPTITPAPVPSSADVILFPGISASGPCKNVICYDYINTCSIRYGTCFAACAANARPTFSGPACEGGKFHSSFSKSEQATASLDSCGYKCDYRTDSCSNTFGPGCYTSCPGTSAPFFTTPVCETAAPPVRIVVVTPVPVMSTMALVVPLDALNRRQVEETASSTSTDSLPTSSDAFYSSTDALPSSTDALSSSTDSTSTSTDASTSTNAVSTPADGFSSSSCFKGVACDTSSSSIEASSTFAAPVITPFGNATFASNATGPAPVVTMYTPEPIPEGGATIGAQLSTIRPQEYGYLPSADIMDPPATAGDNPVAAATPEPQSTNTMADDPEPTSTASVDPQMLNSAIFSVQYISSADVASTTSAVSAQPIETQVSPQSSGEIADSDTIVAASSQTSTDSVSTIESLLQTDISSSVSWANISSSATSTELSARFTSTELSSSIVLTDTVIAIPTAVADSR